MLQPFKAQKVASISSSCLLASRLTGSASMLQLLGKQSFKSVSAKMHKDSLK